MARKRPVEGSVFAASHGGSRPVNTPPVKRVKKHGTPRVSVASYASHHAAHTHKTRPKIPSAHSKPVGHHRKRIVPTTSTTTKAINNGRKYPADDDESYEYESGEDDEEVEIEEESVSEEVEIEDDVQEEDDEEGDDEEEEEEEEEITAPVVFQCATCRSIFGDSYSFVLSNADLLLVTLGAVTNIAVANETQTSKEGLDMGSSFQELLCKQCQTVLGRKYLTTPLPLDAIRSLYSFNTNAIASYQLGYPQLSQEGDGNSHTSVEEITAATLACDKAITELSADRREISKLREDMTKVQNLLLVVDERLHHLETEEPNSEEEDEEEQTGGANTQAVATAGAAHG